MTNKNRQIYREDPPEPCLKEKKAEKLAKGILAAAKTKKEKFISDMDKQESDVLYYPKKIKSHNEAIITENDKSEKLDEEVNELTKFLIENCQGINYIPFVNFSSCISKESEREGKLKEKVSIAEKIKKYKAVVVDAESKLRKATNLLNATAKDFYVFLDDELAPAEDLELEKRLAYSKCLDDSTRTTTTEAPATTTEAPTTTTEAPTSTSPLPFRFKNLISSCKEIKQKIKTLNQKFISLKYKLLDLNDGINSLGILNIDKNLYDEKIKISKELIVKLDKPNPEIIANDSSFDANYKKAQDNLTSYQMESNILRSKIKISKEKVKTIPDKKNRLKTKISNLFKQFRKCLKT